MSQMNQTLSLLRSFQVLCDRFYKHLVPPGLKTKTSNKHLFCRDSLQDPRYRRSLLHQINKSFEVMCCVVRAGCGFRMILDRDNRQRRVTHALDTLIIEIDMRHFDFGWEAIGLHRKAMIM